MDIQETVNYNEQEQIRRDKLAALRGSGADPFVHVKYNVTAHSRTIRENFETMDGTSVGLAGRLMTRRIMGKASFFDLQDAEGRIQVYVRADAFADTENAAEAYKAFKDYDIGDIVGVTGTVFRTHAGEISVKASSITLLAKSLQVPPEKFHGLKDQEARYRRRYVDLIVNPETKDVFIKRTAIIKAVREFLDNRGYLEVETPVLQTVSCGAAARPFATKHNTLHLDMFMRIALELPLKRLIIGGFDRVYELGRCYRNEGMSIKHNPEFTMLELYEAYTDYHGMMELTEALFREAALKATGTLQLPYGEHIVDLETPFAKLTMIDAVKKYAGVDFSGITAEQAFALAESHHFKLEKWHSKGHILEMFFEEYAEKNLIQPTFIMDYPIEISYLTKRKPGNPEFTERFELFIVGREFANAYSELNDPIDQRSRFEYQEQLKKLGDEEASQFDEDFLLAMEYGMPPTGGMGMGIDRLVMLLTNSHSIRDVLLFPTMKPL